MSEQLQNNPHQPLIDAYNQYGAAMQSAVETRAQKVEEGFVHGTEDGKMLQTGHVVSLADEVEHGKTQQEVASMDNEIAATKAKLENPFLRSEERAKLKADLKDYKALKKVAKSEHQETVDAFRDLLSAEAQAKVQEDVDSRYDEFWGDDYFTPKTEAAPADDLGVPSWVNGEKAAELPKREVGATLDGTEGTHSYADEKAKAEEQPEAPEEEEVVRGGIRGRWNRIRRGLQGYSLGNARTNGQFVSAWLQSRRSGRSANQETEGVREQSPIRRVAPYIGAAAAGAALVAGVWLQNKGYINVLPHYNGNTDSWVFNELFDLNPFNGHTLAHDLGTQEFADFMSKVNELKDSGLTDAQIGEMLDNLAKSKS